MFINEYNRGNLISVIRIITVLSFIIFYFANDAIGQESIEVTYKEKIVPSTHKTVKLPFVSKVARKSSRASMIKARNKPNDERICKCIEYAFSIWENQIFNCDSIFIDVYIGNLDCDTQVTVKYGVYNGLYIPSALQTYLNQPNQQDHTLPDGVITINTSTEWDYSIGDGISGNCKNLTFALMRAIAKVLGFGSTVNMNSYGEYKFQNKRGYSVFDDLIINSQNVKLTSIETLGGKANPGLANYINSGTRNFWAVLREGKYELQSPPYSVYTQPFSYLKDESSLMRPIIDEGSYVLSIDSATMAILNELGWNMSSSKPIKIISEDGGENGIMSAYTSHTFRLQYGSVVPKNPHWELIMTLKDGTKTISVLPDSNYSCVVPSISDESSYEIDSDGDIKGELRFSCIINGQRVNSDPYKIYFELRPIIECASIDKIVDNSPLTSYDAYFKVKYRGAEKITVSVEEEYGSKLKSKIIREPYITSGVIQYITSPYYAWMDFIAENKYGKSVFTIELGPYGEILSNATSPIEYSIDSMASSPVILEEDKENSIYEVYDFMGSKVMITRDLAVLERLKGMFIVLKYYDGKLLKTIKWCKNGE